MGQLTLGRKSENGFSVAELILSLGFIATALLAVIGLTVALNRTGQESADRVTAATLAESQIQKTIAAGQQDTAGFWDLEYPSGTPYDSGTETIDGTEFAWTVNAITVLDGVNDLGSDSGAKSSNRVKKVDIRITWWDSDTQQKAGYGKLEFQASRLVSEVK